jgi:metal-dependent amidase/aminoacylase/carboxypeptidase family protein
LEQRPGAFIFAGQAMPDAASPHSQGLHTPGYDFNDALIPLAVEYFADLAETRLALSGRQSDEIAERLRAEAAHVAA